MPWQIDSGHPNTIKRRDNFGAKIDHVELADGNVIEGLGGNLERLLNG